MSEIGYPIDFVIPWVDGSDPAWQREKSKWESKEPKSQLSEWTSGAVRYQDWGLLRYWFRGVEKFTPWVNKVYFITWGHLPEWLDSSCGKLKIVKHEDFIPEEYLPTFNSRVIELNLHRIDALSERFVYFNDDLFLLRSLDRELFFKGGLPRDFAGLRAARLHSRKTSAPPMNAMVINDHFMQRDVLRKHFRKWLNPHYGLGVNLRTLCALPWPYFSALQANHLPSSFLKSTFSEVWSLEQEKLDADCRRKFREFSGVNQWLVRDWQRVKGEFVPVRQYRNCNVNCDNEAATDSIARAMGVIIGQRVPMISVNDYCSDALAYELWSSMLRDAFETILPEQSSFEIDAD